MFVQVRLSVEVPPAVCDDCYKRVISEFMKQAKVKSFLYKNPLRTPFGNLLKKGLFLFLLGTGFSSWKECSGEYSYRLRREAECSEGHC